MFPTESKVESNYLQRGDLEPTGKFIFSGFNVEAMVADCTSTSQTVGPGASLAANNLSLRQETTHHVIRLSTSSV